jgi:AcrR family transcriptional regulator
MTRGYRAVSTRDIAEVVGVTQPALYHHFGGKEALYVAVLEEELASMAVDLDRATAFDASPAERLVAVATVLASRGEHDLAQMFHDLRQEISGDNRRRIGIAFQDAMMRPILAVIDALAKDGAIDLGGTGLARDEIAMFLLSIVRMLVDSGRGSAGGPARTPEAIGLLAVRLLLDGIAPHTSP